MKGANRCIMEKPGYIKDPVCGIEVEPHQHALVYREIDYAFCSRQCQERFLAHPHLYVGLPGQKAPRQEGRQLIKQRKMRLAQPFKPEEARELASALSALPGVKYIHAEANDLTISYDLLLVTAEQIEEQLATAGVKLGDGWAERLRLAFLHYEEELEVSGLEMTDKTIYG